MESLTLDKRLFSLLAEEIAVYFPQFEPYSTDYQMMMYAIRDLKEWLKWKMSVDTFHEIDEKIGEHLEKDPSALKSLLKCWTSLWVSKWNERVEVLSTAPNPPKDVLKRINEAKKPLRTTEYIKELKELVKQKLLSQGEVCMVSFIAQQLITEELTRRSMDTTQRTADPSLLDIFNSISLRISKLSTEKGPLVYLSINPI